jgi:hypothetical protein
MRSRAAWTATTEDAPTPQYVSSTRSPTYSTQATIGADEDLLDECNRAVRVEREMAEPEHVPDQVFAIRRDQQRGIGRTDRLRVRAVETRAREGVRLRQFRRERRNRLRVVEAGGPDSDHRHHSFQNTVVGT